MNKRETKANNVRRKKRSRKSRGFAARVWRWLLFEAMALICRAILCTIRYDDSFALHDFDIADNDHCY